MSLQTWQRFYGGVSVTGKSSFSNSLFSTEAARWAVSNRITHMLAGARRGSSVPSETLLFPYRTAQKTSSLGGRFLLGGLDFQPPRLSVPCPFFLVQIEKLCLIQMWAAGLILTLWLWVKATVDLWRVFRCVTVFRGGHD